MHSILCIILLFILTPILKAGVPLPDGMYAEITTSHGFIRAELHYTNAPMTVANFVGLSEGTLPWLDESTGLMHLEKFYDGKRIHRVAPGFVIQGGSHTGLSSDDFGYRFDDEFSAALRHDPYTLSMANSGPMSNGSQFFICLTNLPGLDDKHSVFGTVIEGTNVVDSIAAEATDSNSVPLVDVTIDSVDILRIGAQAQSFDVTAHNLPVLSNEAPQLDSTLSNLSWTAVSNTMHILGVSTNLPAFRQGVRTFHEGPSTTRVEVLSTITNSSGERAYYTLSKVQYGPDAAHPPNSLTGRSILYTVTKGTPGALILIQYLSPTLAQVNHSYGGAFQNGYLINYSYLRDLPYRGDILQNASTATNGLNLVGVRMAFPTNDIEGIFHTVITQTTPTSSVSAAISGTFAPFIP